MDKLEHRQSEAVFADDVLANERYAHPEDQTKGLPAPCHEGQHETHPFQISP